MDEITPDQTVFDMWEALSNIQKEMPVIGRNKTADVGKFSYSYADLEKVWEVAAPIIAKNGFTVINYGEVDKVTTLAFHTSGESIKSQIALSQLDPQKKGAEITYYRRYNLCMLFNIIVANEDKDAAHTEEMSQDKLETIEEQLTLLNSVDELTGYYKQLGNPKDKRVIALFSKRKKSL